MSRWQRCGKEQEPLSKPPEAVDGWTVLCEVYQPVWIDCPNEWHLIALEVGFFSLNSKIDVVLGVVTRPVAPLLHGRELESILEW